MTSLVITPASVIAGTGAKKRSKTAGATITAGQTVYLDTADDRLKLADADGATALRAPWGIALHGASAGQPLTVQWGGLITIGATVTVGEIYVQDDTPGGIMPEGDLESGDYVCILGVGISATQIMLIDGFLASGVAVPA